MVIFSIETDLLPSVKSPYAGNSKECRVLGPSTLTSLFTQVHF